MNVPGDAPRENAPDKAPDSAPDSAPDNAGSAAGSEPFQDVAEAMMQAADAVNAGAGEPGPTKVGGLLPAAGNAVSMTVYTTCYWLSFGVVFPTTFVASLIPMDNAMGRGLSEGAGAAKAAVTGLRQKSPIEAPSVDAGDIDLAAAPA